MQRAARCTGSILQLLNTARANATRWKVAHAHEARIVVRILQKTQVSQRVLNLSALKKAQAAIHAIRYAGVEQRGLNHAALRIAAVENRNFRML